MKFDPEKFPALAKEANHPFDDMLGISIPDSQSTIGNDIDAALLAYTIGDALKLARQRVGVSGAAAGETVGINRQRVSQLENLKTASVELATLVKYLHGLGYDLSLTLKPRNGDSEIITNL